MQDILDQLSRWQEAGKDIALATVVQTWSSSPRRPGAKMAVTRDGEIAGSVSGGCVENAVLEAALDALASQTARLLQFHVTDKTAWDVGLACGGSLDVFVQPLEQRFFDSASQIIRNKEAAVAATVIGGSQELLGRQMLIRDHTVLEGATASEWQQSLLAVADLVSVEGAARREHIHESIEVFLEPIVPAPSLIVVGGVHIAIALVSLAKTLGYETVLIDPRKGWGNEGRFADADRLVGAWPEEAFRSVVLTNTSAVVTLTHDPKLDDPALAIALASPAFYVGALGSRSTQEKRRQRLVSSGVPESQLARLCAPVGIDIGAESPEEIALAILAQVVQARRKHRARP